MLCTVENIQRDYLILSTCYPQDDQCLLIGLLYKLLISNEFFYQFFAS